MLQFVPFISLLGLCLISGSAAGEDAAAYEQVFGRDAPALQPNQVFKLLKGLSESQNYQVPILIDFNRMRKNKCNYVTLRWLHHYRMQNANSPNVVAYMEECARRTLEFCRVALENELKNTVAAVRGSKKLESLVKSIESSKLEATSDDGGYVNGILAFIKSEAPGANLGNEQILGREMKKVARLCNEFTEAMINANSALRYKKDILHMELNGLESEMLAENRHCLEINYHAFLSTETQQSFFELAQAKMAGGAR